MSSPRDLLKQALDTQESGNFLEALQLENQALIEFQKAGDYPGMAEITILHSKTFKHLYQSTNDKNYLILARSEAQAAVEIADKSGVEGASAIPNFVLAQMHEALDEIPQALNAYRKSLEQQPQAPELSHRRLSVKADIEGHYALCLHKSSDPQATDLALKALAKLENATDANDYERNVWISGAHMRLAYMYSTSDPIKAVEHLTKAKNIISADDRLALRKNQLEKLTKEIQI